MGTIRVLHCPTLVGGHPQGLARVERELGLESWSVAFGPNFFGYEADEVLLADRHSLFVYAVKREVKRWYLLWRALKDFDIVHFNFGESLMPQWFPRGVAADNGHHWLKNAVHRWYAGIVELRDLSWLKRARKGIVVTYQGDDARQGDFCRSHFEISPVGEVEPGYYSAGSDAHKRKRIAKFARYADRIFALNPDLLHVLPPQAQFLPYAHLDLRDWRAVDQGSFDAKRPVIVHAPSHRGVKGTRFILEAISRLRAAGVDLNFILVEALPHAEARHIYERADLLVDQLLTGWYGGLAVELMALGKPVVCYIREGDLKFLPEQMRRDLPIINATPATLCEVLREWLTVRRHELREMGWRSRAYVERWHDPLQIATALKREYEAVMLSKQQKSRC